MPTVDEQRFIYSNLNQLLPVQWQIPEDFFAFSHFLRVVDGIDMQASPGYPYKLTYTNNAQFFSHRDGVTDATRLVEIWELVELQVRERFADPIYLFIKQEPHKISKKGRKRLISSVSIIDQLIDHMLFDCFNAWVIDDAAYGPIKAGWSPQSGGWKVMPMDGISIDKTAWDWTVKPWLPEMCLEYRRQTARGVNKDLWYELASWRYAELFRRPKLALPSGEILEQGWEGVMKSGCVNTIIDNSLMQLILHLRVCSTLGYPPAWIWCMGDDTRQAPVPSIRDYRDALEQFCVVKECTTACEFAGYRFQKGGRLEPLYKGKHAFVMLHCAPNVQADIARAYTLLYHRSRELPGIEYIVSHFGEPLDEMCRDLLWDGEV